jgi:hypothetical protein
LLALDFLHTEAKVIHTGEFNRRAKIFSLPFFEYAVFCLSKKSCVSDIQESNVLLRMNDETAEQDFEKFETEELTSPTARKIDGDRVIYTSRPLVPPTGDL